MKRVALVVCLIAIAGIWIWAIATRERVKPLPERLCGTFDVYRWDSAEGGGLPNPIVLGQRYRYTFRADGTYRIAIFVSGGHEMLRTEGIAILDRKQVLALHRVSENRRESRAEPEHYGTWWGQDEEGPFLLLRHVEKGHSLYLRRVEEKPATAAKPD